ncbi:MAG: hypothetical protein EXR60_00295 [Dehalococcoidia bacterium]|nr:hypothetical protein [Dehalococcoidia bacterium]
MVKRPRRAEVQGMGTQPVYLVKAPKWKEIEALKKQQKGATAQVYVYPEWGFGSFAVDDLVPIVGEALGQKALERGEYFAYNLERLSFKNRRHEVNDRAMRLAWARVRDRSLNNKPIPGQHLEMTPWLGEVDYEKTRLGADLHPDFGTLENYKGKPSGIMYNAEVLQDICGSVLPEEEIEGFHHVIITSQILGAWSEASKSWEVVPFRKGSIVTLVSAVEREQIGEHPGPRTSVVVDPDSIRRSITFLDREPLKARVRQALAK